MGGGTDMRSGGWGVDMSSVNFNKGWRVYVGVGVGDS